MMLVEFAGLVLSTMMINYPNKIPNLEQRLTTVFATKNVTTQPSEPYRLSSPPTLETLVTGICCQKGVNTPRAPAHT